jgi:DNA-binding NarL/FixJ family response regulator
MSVNPDSIRILAVDDHPMFQEGLAMMLATQPDMSLVAQASNGREALQQFRQSRPDITLMDLQMPVMNGLDAMVAIRKEFPEAKIIILTTCGSSYSRTKALRLVARADAIHAETFGAPISQYVWCRDALPVPDYRTFSAA